MDDIGRTLLRRIKCSVRVFIGIPIALLISGFGYKVLHINTSRIGHLITETDCLLKEIKLGTKKERKYVLLFEKSSVSNQAYVDILPGFIRPVAISKSLFRWILLITSSRIVLEDTSHYVTAMYQTADIFRINALWTDKPPALVLPIEWRDQRRSLFVKWGIPESMPYVCVHAREAGYSPSDEQYHSCRNVDIDAFKEAVETLTEQGLAVIRMGDSSMKALGDWGPFVVDYATSSDREPWMDLSISSECLFFLGTSSGASHMAMVFGRPCADRKSVV